MGGGSAREKITCRSAGRAADRSVDFPRPPRGGGEPSLALRVASPNGILDRD